VIGTLILWLGWLMFNGGSSLRIVGADNSDRAERAMSNSIISPAAAGLFSFILRNFILNRGEQKQSRLDITTLTNGILAGLVSITASCDQVEPWAAFIIGIVGSLIYLLGLNLLNKL